MPYGLIDYDTLNNIAKAIRYKANSNAQYYPRDMATAINGIRSGGGLDEPTFYSLQQFYQYYYDQSSFPSLYEFEITNNNPVNQDGYVNYGNISWEGVSPIEATFYRKNTQIIDNGYTYDGYCYGLYLNGNYRSASIVCMEGIFAGSYIREPYCGNYTTSLYNAYSGCYYLKNAICGPRVQLMKRAYRGCGNITEAVVGNSVVDMSEAYSDCGNIHNGISGPNVINMSSAYNYCYNLMNLNIGPKTESIDFVGYYDQNLINCYGGESVIHANNAFSYCENLLNIDPMPKLVDAANMFYNCRKLSQDKYYNFITNCNNLKNAASMFYHCDNLTDIYAIASIENGNFMYSGCINAVNAYIDNDADFANTISMFSYCPNLVNVYGGANLTNMQSMFMDCYNLSMALITPNVINMAAAYQSTNIIDAYCGEYTNDMMSTYNNCSNLVNAVCGNSVTTLYSTYYNCPNLLRAVCGNNVKTMYMAYYNCVNLISYNIGPLVNNIYSAFWNTNIQGDVEIPENVNVISQAFRNCEGIVNAVIKNTTLYSSTGYTSNCFNRTNYSVRRNIVLVHLAAYNNFILYNGAGYFSRTTETYAEPVEVNVNGISYNCVRCAYNTTYNCYIYCME